MVVGTLLKMTFLILHRLYHIVEACSSSKYMSIRDRCATAVSTVARPFERSRIVTAALDEATYSEGYSNRTHGALC